MPIHILLVGKYLLAAIEFARDLDNKNATEWHVRIANHTNLPSYYQHITSMQGKMHLQRIHVAQ